MVLMAYKKHLQYIQYLYLNNRSHDCLHVEGVVELISPNSYQRVNP